MKPGLQDDIEQLPHIIQEHAALTQYSEHASYHEQDLDRLQGEAMPAFIEEAYVQNPQVPAAVDDNVEPNDNMIEESVQEELPSDHVAAGESRRLAVPPLAVESVAGEKKRLKGVYRKPSTKRFEASLWVPTELLQDYVSLDDKDAAQAADAQISDSNSQNNNNSKSKHTNINKKTRNGKQIYLGAFDTEDEAAGAYDRAVLKFYEGNDSKQTQLLNFKASEYNNELELRQTMDPNKYMAYIRGGAPHFAKGRSKYRGVSYRLDVQLYFVTVNIT
ncbi:hypothetical protein GOP47_0015387 [Adiantum capillus-veneris]|uniref:AP2/ERF domain-containing protein n=1 Tax=Adiantum capillus-veneris TaxID=13818 RepID=A0A9D4ZDY3_ADICA|nr:hypothetical protein GOP47_0015387 [Adiantum capillus-veneris]